MEHPLSTPPIDTDDDLFRFCQRNINPEAWRPTIPLVVLDACKGQPNLLAVWVAIKWLIALYAGEGQRGFGTREIAEQAGVGRNSVSTCVQTLIDRELLKIVDYEPVSGHNSRGLRPRPVYQIDMLDLELRSGRTMVATIRDRSIRHPPHKPLPPAQLPLDFDPAHPNDPTVARPTSRTRAGTQPGQTVPLEPEIALHQDRAGIPSGQEEPTVPEMALQQDSSHQSGQSLSESPISTLPGQDWHPTGTGLTPYRDRTDTLPGQDWHANVTWKERKEERKEGMGEGEPTPATVASLPELVRAELRQALSDLLPDITAASAAAPAAPPEAPPDQPPLSDQPRDLWAAIYPQPRPIDLRQLDALASEHDAATGGYGAYWTSKAILAAALVNEQPGVRLVKAVLDRWRAGACYGSDAPAYEKRNGSNPPPPPADPPPDPAADPTADPAPAAPDCPGADPGDDSQAHPAVQLYRERTGARLSDAQSRAIAAAVSDLDSWHQTLAHWQLNGWRTANVGSLLDAYHKRTSADPTSPPPAAPAERVSMLEIDYAPIHPTDKGLWSSRFRDALTTEARRRVLEQFRAWLTEHQELSLPPEGTED